MHFPTWLPRAACPLVLAALVMGCHPSTSAPTPGVKTQSSGETGTASPLPEDMTPDEPSPTPEPRVLLIVDEAGTDLEQALQQWSEARGWSLTILPGSRAEGWEQTPGLQAVVMAAGNAAQLVGDVGQVPVVVVGDNAVQASGQVSTVSMADARFDQAAFLAGAMAGLASQTWMVASIDGWNLDYGPVVDAAFVHGVRYSCGYCTVVDFTGAELTAESLEEWRTDVAFIVAQGGGEALGSALSGAQVRVVWIGSPPQGLDPGLLLGGVAFSPSELVERAIESLLQGAPGQAWAYSAENGGLVLSALNEQIITPGRQRWLVAALDALATGELDVGVDAETGAER